MASGGAVVLRPGFPFFFLEELVPSLVFVHAEYRRNLGAGNEGGLLLPVFPEVFPLFGSEREHFFF